MLLNIKKWSLTGLLILSSSIAYADTTTASFSGVSGSSSNITNFSLSVDGVNINVSGWSDTRSRSNDGPGDGTIQIARDLNKYSNGWGITNRDEGGGSPSHSANNTGNDYDFFLLSFSEVVSLTKATYSWVYGSTGQNQVSVAALDPNDFTGNGSLHNKTWSGIKTDNTLSSDYAQMEKSGGYFTNFAGTNVDNEFSTHWLIGSLNSVFGGNKDMERNDGMKLASVSFDKQEPVGPASIPEPSSILLFCLAIMGLTASNRRKIK
ncbi:exosortase-dependent surface protein XDP1 [Colwellia psychrerythraea]|uniref:PEP motif putative anchor domain protein n=1 Tax=Colwellia psychrerythraea TaxID=28229 RepID=A0A099KM66_COLPS|nr:exosortase-dependent surface protein XDP1 [Colwellia psychrerythraea]KGJ91546.1 PEP motif putative anchor domain protein [Colwellia psychrerythraea]